MKLPSLRDCCTSMPPNGFRRKIWNKNAPRADPAGREPSLRHPRGYGSTCVTLPAAFRCAVVQAALSLCGPGLGKWRSCIPCAACRTGETATGPSLQRRRDLHAEQMGVPLVPGLGHGFPLSLTALVYPEFAKKQLVLMTREWYMHPNGQLPAYKLLQQSGEPAMTEQTTGKEERRVRLRVKTPQLQAA